MPIATLARDRPGLWFLACAICAAAGFLAGRQNRGPMSSVSSSSHDLHTTARVAPATSTAHPPPAAASDPTAAQDTGSSPRRKTLIALLRHIEDAGDVEDLDTMFQLAAWVQAADQDELAEALALGTEIITPQGAGDAILPIMVFTRWAAIDGPAAFEQFLTLPPEMRTRQSGRELFKSWVAHGDPQDAIDHLQAYGRTDPDNASGQGRMLEDILAGWERRDPAAALARARQFAASDDPDERSASRDLARVVATRTLETESPAAALRWIDQWPDPTARDRIRLSLLLGMSSADGPNPAIGEVIAQIESPAALAKNGKARSYVEQLARSDLDAARLWSASLPAAAREFATGIIAKQLAGDGRWSEVAAWTDSQTTSLETRNQARAEAAFAAARSGALAAAVALTSETRDQDSAAVQKTRAGLLKNWMENDPARTELLLLHALAHESAAPNLAP